MSIGNGGPAGPNPHGQTIGRIVIELYQDGYVLTNHPTDEMLAVFMLHKGTDAIKAFFYQQARERAERRIVTPPPGFGG